MKNSIEVKKDEFDKNDLLNSSFKLKDRLLLDKEMFGNVLLTYNFIKDEDFYMFLCLDMKDYYDMPNYDDFEDILHTPFYFNDYDDNFIKKMSKF